MSEARVFGCFSIGSVAETYEEIYVPRIFVPWARLLVDHAQPVPGESVLDVATGPGTVARIAAEHVGQGGQVVATDISPAMIEIARGKSAKPGAAPIEYIVAPAAPLPVGDAAFDLVACQQGLQFFPDRPAALREMHRALRPGGRLVAAVWREIELQPCFAAIDAALRESIPVQLAEPYGAPFRWSRAAELSAALHDAGFTRISIEQQRLPLVFEGGIAQAQATLAASPVATAVAELREDVRANLFSAVERRLRLLLVDGKISTSMVSNVAIARR